MRFVDITNKVDFNPAEDSNRAGISARPSTKKGQDKQHSPRVTLKSIHKLKLRQRARQAEVQRRLDFLPHMYGDRNEDELEMARKKDVEKQENREHIRKAALRAIRTQRKREQETNDDAARYLKKKDDEQAQRIKALKQKFDKIRSS